MECGSQRGLYLTSEEAIHKALSFRCTSCVPECGERWQRRNLAIARRNYHRLSLQEQLQEVYEVILAAYDAETQTVTLMIGGCPIF